MKKKKIVLPRFSWSQSGSELTVTSEVSPARVELWAAVSCNTRRMDWRLANLDNPCECGSLQDGVCFNEESVYTAEVLEETSPGDGRD